ncbi:MAG TPA: extracellular solute-binding protein [Rubellimicrobium sp.]|nr:extracellular solute-binding protein [Rubellimicrobium sp.]
MTSSIRLKGLAWGHRRATGPLVPLTERFAQLRPDIAVDWIVRPLSDFEHQGLREVASVYDLIIYDHPFSGAIVESGAFLPLSGREELPLGTRDAGRYLGSSLRSYRYGGTVWGLPIDAASQHAIVRTDLLGDEPVPTSWEETLALGRRLTSRELRLGLAVTSPHGLLVIGALMANLGAPWETDQDRTFGLDRTAFLTAYEAVVELLKVCPPEVSGWNAIDLHDAMTTRNDIAFCPCTYGYGTYGEEDQPHRLAFAPFAGFRAPFHVGSILGGTGLAVSRNSTHPEAALALVRFAASDEGQALMATRHGQPALTHLWHDGALDQRFNGFFSGARSSIETAWVRPRHRGYIPFQNEAGQVVAEALGQKESGAWVFDRIEPLCERVNS